MSPAEFEEQRVAVRESIEGGLGGGERQRFDLLYRVGREVLGASSTSELCELALTLVFECLRAERAVVLLKGPTGEMTSKLARHRSGEIAVDELRVPSSIVREATTDQVGILTTDAAADERFRERDSVRQEHVRSALCAPLWDGESVLGVFYLDSRIKTYAFTRDDLLLLNAIANLVAIRLRQESLHAALAEERVVRSNLGRFHSPAVVEEILRRPDHAVPGLEEREATILFADLKSFTAMAERMSPAQLARLLNEYYALVTGIVFAHGGSVNEYVGDSVLAVFGAPVRSEDHALRAVRAAIQLHRGLRCPPETATELKRGVQARIGINSGLVVAGSVGPPDRLKYAVIGDAVNVAARLEHLGEPGTISLGENTYHQLGGQIPCTSLGPVRLQGRDGPIHVYRVDA